MHEDTTLSDPEPNLSNGSTGSQGTDGSKGPHGPHGLSVPYSTAPPRGFMAFMERIMRWMFFLLVMRPLAIIILGLNIRHYERLPHVGPAVIVANHNSHLDALVLMTIFPIGMLEKIRPVAAADYFLRNRCLAWFSTRILGIIPVDRQVRSKHADPIAGISEALGRQQVVILFPEGQRGEPERLEKFKTGIAHLAQRHPDVPVVPIFLHGLGKALPKGEGLLVPFICDVFVGESLFWEDNRAAFMHSLEERMQNLAAEGHFSPWV